MYPIFGSAYEKDFYVTQAYGLTDFAKSATGKKAYKNFPGGMHPGIDFGTHGKSLDVIALVDGKIVAAALDGGWGNHVELEGADGFRRQYAHLSYISCKVGQMVKRGDVLGKVGTTGASTGVHLHYGNRRKKQFGGFEYRNPSIDFVEIVLPKPPEIKRGQLIMSNMNSSVFVYTGTKRHALPDWPTKVLLFGEGGENIETIPQDFMAKIPLGDPIPSLAT